MADGKVIIDSKLDNSGLDKGLSEMQGKLKSAGGQMKAIGKKMTKSLTLPIVAAATGAVKMASDFDDSMRKVKATMGDNLGSSTKEANTNFKALREEAMKLGATTAHSASDASGAMKELAQMGFNTNEILAATPIVLDAASAAGLELDFVAKTIASSMNQFGVQIDKEGKNVERFGDVMVKAGQISGTSMDEIGQALEYVGSSASNAGMDIEQTSAYIGILGDNGIKGSKAGTALNSMLRDMKNKVKDGNLEFGNFNVAMYDSNGEMRDMTDIMVDVEKGLEGMSDEQRDAAINAVFGTQSQQALNAILGEGTDKVKDYEDQLKNANGTSKKAAEEMEGGIGGAFRALKSATEGLAIAFGDVLAPMVQKVAESIADLFLKFTELSDGQKKLIVGVLAAVAAIGPLLMLLGGIVSVVGTVSTAIGVFTGATATATGAAAGLAAVLGFIASPAGLAILAIGGISANIALLVKDLKEDAIPEVERFGDSVSENTQEAVGAFMDMSEEADVALKSLAWSQEEVTSQMATDMAKQQENITNTLLTAIGDRHEQEKADTIANFENINILNDEQKERLLQGIDERFEEESRITQEGHDRILEIQNLAAEEGRAITHAESEEILSIRNDMTEQSVKIMSENEAEQKVILEKMKENATTISAKEAAEVVKNSNEKKEGVIKEADEQFDKTVEWAIRQRDETGDLSAEEARAVIQEAQTKRDDSVKSAEDMHNKVVREAKNQAKEHVHEVNWSTGEVMSKWEVMKGDVTRKASEMAKNTKNKFSEMSESASTKMGEVKKWVNTNIVDAAKDVKDKAGDMAKDLGKNLSEMASDASTKMDDVKTAVSTGISNALTAVSSKFQDFKDAGATIGGNIASGISSAMSKVKEAAGNLVSAARDFLPFSPAKVGPLKDLNKLNFGGPISDSIEKAIPSVQAEMNHLLRLPNASYTRSAGVGSDSINNSKTYGDTNITIVSPKNTPSENAREIKRVGRELSLGY